MVYKFTWCTHETAFDAGVFIYFGAFLLVDWVVKFELQFLLVVYFPTTNRPGPK